MTFATSTAQTVTLTKPPQTLAPPFSAPPTPAPTANRTVPVSTASSFARKKKFCVYKPNRATTGSAVQFDFNPAKESIFVELAKQMPNPAGTGKPGDNKFDWANKLNVKLGLTDIGKLLLVLGANGNAKFQSVNLFHDPQKSYEAHDVDVSKEENSKKNATVNFSAMQTGYFLKVSIQQLNGKVESIGVPFTDDEAALLRVLLEQAVRRCYEW